MLTEEKEDRESRYQEIYINLNDKFGQHAVTKLVKHLFL